MVCSRPMVLLWALFSQQMVLCVSAQWVDPFIDLSEEAKMEEVALNNEDGDATVIRMRENLPKGFLLGTLLSPEAPVSFDCYHIRSNDSELIIDEPIASVSEDSLEMFLEQEFDFEVLRDKELILDFTFTCKLGSGDARCPNDEDCRSFKFVIANENDNFPNFETRPESQNLPENKDLPSILDLEASDLDQLSDSLRMVLVGEDQLPLELIQIDPPAESTNSWFRLKTKEGMQLDYETQRNFRLEIQLIDNEDEFGFTHDPVVIDVFIGVNDKQDTEPLWVKRPPGLFEIDEDQTETEAGIFQISAQDGDREKPREVFYEVASLKDTDEASYDFLSVDESGNVFFNKGVDREELGTNNYFVVEFEAVEDGCKETEDGEEQTDPCRSSRAKMSLSIKDINDNTPSVKVEKEEITIDENPLGFLTQFGEIVIEDKDFDPDTSSYTISIEMDDSEVSGNILSVQPTFSSRETLVYIQVEDQTYFNFEERQTVKFSLVVQGQGKDDEPVKTSLTIKLEDVNDNDPIFLDSEEFPLSIEIPEDVTLLPQDKERYVVGTVQAKDKDQSEQFGSGSLRYTISSADIPLLKIEEESGQLFFHSSDNLQNALDYDTNPQPNIMISVKDSYGQGLGVRSDIQSYKIILTDINDSTPSISSVNGNEFCTLENHFGEKCTGENIINVELLASDVDTDSNIILFVDWEKSIAKKDFFTVPQEEYDYTNSFLVVKSTNDDGTLQGKIIEGENILDREKVDTITLYIVAKDENTATEGPDGLFKYGSEDTITLTIAIDDDDDTAPEFIRPETWNFLLDEDQEGSQFFERELSPLISARDFDTGISDQQYTFSLMPIGDTPDGLIDLKEYLIVDIEAQAILVTKKVIDRDQEPLLTSNGLLEYDVSVSDGSGNMRTEKIEVRINDLNDNSPQFDEEGYKFKILENSTAGQYIGTVSASDKDASEAYRTVTFAQLGEDIPFYIDTDSGELTVKEGADLDFDELEQEYIFKVEALDNIEGASKKDTALVTVSLINVNDNPPIIDQSFVNIRSPNTLETNEIVTTFTATDKDDGGRDKILFSLKDVPDPFPFRIEDNGQLILEAILGEVTSSYSFTVVAANEDGLSSQLNSVLVIYDINDKIPVFSFPTGQGLTYFDLEMDVPAAVVDLETNEAIQFSATDDDTSTPFKTIKYSFAGDGNSALVIENFAINEDTGVLTLLNDITSQLEVEDLVDINVMAIDNPENVLEEDGINVIHKNSTRVLHLKAYKDYEPIFKDMENPPFTFMENTDALKRQLSFAEDKNIIDGDNPNEAICYYIFDDESKLFQVDKLTNILSLVPNAQLDRESKKEHQFIIGASNDCAEGPNVLPGKESRLLVTVEVGDVNDNPPTFDEDQVFAGISVDEDASQWSRLVSVDDQDKEVNSVFEFRLENIITSPGNVGLDEIQVEQPFNVSNEVNQAKLEVLFTPTSDMEGFFLFDLIASDGVFEASTPVKVIIIAKENQVTLTFDNPLPEVEAHDNDIKKIFEQNLLGWIYTKDTARKGPKGSGAMVECHFVVAETLDPVRSNIVISYYDEHSLDIMRQLEEEASLYLNYDHGINIGAGTVPPQDGPDILAIVFIIGSSILAIMLVFMMITYFIRVSNLERQVRALGATTFGSVDSGLNRLGQEASALPGTNMHTDKGANPVWNVENEMTRYTNEGRIAETSLDNPLSQGQSNPLYKNPPAQALYEDATSSLSGSESGDSVLVHSDEERDINEGFRGNQYINSIQGDISAEFSRSADHGNPLYQSDEEM